MNNDEQLRYPTGRFTARDSYAPEEVKANISRIEAVPAKIEALVSTLTPQQLATPYRPGGWTALQVIHHIPDSHMNAYIRVKWSLTEDTPTIKAYDETTWALTPETRADPSISIALLKALHIKWVTLLKGLTKEDLEKKFFHPDSKKYIRLDQAIASYAWHGEHHLGHLKIVAGQL
ncbi:YfiT family bacillithiol transferase [Ohtaekwangia sp.]|uniref:YfiT family bacillithiol transferase n=1 Tax=Ohtaekwangia sp. TaxID=2066019 RepID=UPI002F954830